MVNQRQRHYGAIMMMMAAIADACYCFACYYLLDAGIAAVEAGRLPHVY